MKQEGKQGWEGAAGSWAAVDSATLETAGSREVSGNPETRESASHTSEVHGETFQLHQRWGGWAGR